MGLPTVLFEEAVEPLDVGSGYESWKSLALHLVLSYS